MIKFTPGQNADTANQAIKSSLKTHAQAKQCIILWFSEILSRKLYKSLGYSSINQYAKMELGFSSSRTGIYLKLSRNMADLPRMKEEVVSGKIGYTVAETLLPVIDKTNEKEWLDFAKKHTRAEVENVVKTAQKAARKKAADKTARQPSLIPLPSQNIKTVVPVYVSLKMSPTQLARYESLWEKIFKQNKASSDKIETLLHIMESFTIDSPEFDQRPISKNGLQNPSNPEPPNPTPSCPKSSYPTPSCPKTQSNSKNSTSQSSRQQEHSTPGTSPYQIHIHLCPECESTTVQTSKGELEISTSELNRARCDCLISKPNHRNVSSIPPSIKRQVLEKARYKCQRPGCHHTRFLEIHHVVPRAQGGSNKPENLRCLCGACHKLLHEQFSPDLMFQSRENQSEYSWNQRVNN